MNFSSERVYPGLESFAGFSGESGFGTPAIGKVQFLQAKAESPTQRAYLETQGAGTGYQGRAHSEPQAARAAGSVSHLANIQKGSRWSIGNGGPLLHDASGSFNRPGHVFGSSGLLQSLQSREDLGVLNTGNRFLHCRIYESRSQGH